MPNIEQIPATLYQPLDAYHYLIDNVPLTNILARIDFINNAVDIASNQLRDAVGTAGSLANRLDTSTNLSGTLIAGAVDDSEHNIGYHTDGNGPDSVAYVRMQSTERAKLALIAEEATSLSLMFNGDILLNSGTISVLNSTGIAWTVESGNQLTANLTFPTTSIHQHYYDQLPQFVGMLPDYTNYQISSTVVPYMEGSMRVYINGYRLSESQSVIVPISNTPTPLTYTENFTGGTFSLSQAITASDIIRIDFDIEI